MDNADFDNLLNFLIPFAEQSLKKRKEFHPFAAAVDSAGAIQAHAVTGEIALDSNKAIETFAQQLREHADNGEIRASGICSDVKLQEPIQIGMNDAIHVSLEEDTGRAISIIVPYKTGFLGRLKMGELVAQASEPTIFSQ